MVSYETKIGQTTVRFSTPSSHHATKCPQNSIQRDQIMPTRKECPQEKNVTTSVSTKRPVIGLFLYK